MSKAGAGLLAVIVVVVAVQFVPVNRANYAPVSGISAPAEVRSILERSCYDCHSGATKWPWYSRVAPVSWVLARDVHEGREHLDFSRWGEYSEREKVKLAGEIVEETAEGGMPLGAYLLLHKNAKLDAEDLDTLSRWAVSLGADVE